MISICVGVVIQVGGFVGCQGICILIFQVLGGWMQIPSKCTPLTVLSTAVRRCLPFAGVHVGRSVGMAQHSWAAWDARAQIQDVPECARENGICVLINSQPQAWA
eukprot:TRINITY_DN14368_c2_g1_i1.p2 TRINITY_DN14368_c2_g1~~TRINITY_DN14368_c2_g1_i1.p2  ORF type:complete len:105 (-),score=3.40 TRINITY_DN14368_c2_g1_i1:5-319(-)